MPNNIKEIREKKGMKQAELARMLKVTRSYLNRVENGKQNLSISMAVRIAKILDSSLDDIFLR